MNPARYAARMILGQLSVIQKQIPGITKTADVESLHQLRTFSRRLANSLGIFKPFLPHAQRRSWQRSLRCLSRISGPARDLDVQQAFLKELQIQNKKFFAAYFSTSQKAKLRRGGFQKGIGSSLGERNSGHQVLAHLLLVLQRKRSRLQPKLVRALETWQRENMLQEMRRVAEAATKSQSPKDTLQALAQKKVQKRLRQVFSWRRYVNRPRCVHELHQLRISVKHVRYTLEFFKDVYPPSLEMFHKKILRLHRQLGEVHDADVWLMFLKDYESTQPRSSGLRADVRLLAQFLVRRRRKAYQQFVCLWRNLERENFFSKLENFFERDANR